MVYWITGRSGAGKTSLAYRIAAQVNGIVIDGDAVRGLFPASFTAAGRRAHIMRSAKIARLIEAQGVTAIVACVSPLRKWRAEAQALFDECVEIYLPSGSLWKNTVYEEPLKDEQNPKPHAQRLYKILETQKNQSAERTSNTMKKIVLLKDIVIPRGTMLTEVTPGSKKEYAARHYECCLDLHKDLAPDFVVSEEALTLASDTFAEVK